MDRFDSNEAAPKSRTQKPALISGRRLLSFRAPTALVYVLRSADLFSECLVRSSQARHRKKPLFNEEI